jgi:bacillithiol biosynthesis cysteine-adding enzyme BshC
VSLLREQNGDSPSLDLLAQQNTVAVVTGQQVGLFSGPAYTIYKALTAARLAERMKNEGTSAVPIFWLATEDHDFAEVNHAWFFDARNTPVPFKIEGLNGSGAPVGGLQVREWPLEEARRTLAEFPFGEDAYRLLEQTYTPGATMGGAFRELLRRLLDRFGILFLDPMHPKFRELAAPLVRRALEAAPDLTAKLLHRNKQLETSGYHAQVHVEDKTSLVFLIDQGRRVAMKRQNGFYYSDAGRYTAADLANRSEDLSPNALLRPVVQDYVLPTAVYVGGPAELAYLAQSQVLYEKLLGYMPKPASRAGFTIIDAHTAKLMQRYHLQFRDFLHGEEPLREKMAQSLIPAEVQREFAETKSALQARLNGLEEALIRFDPNLAQALRTSRSKISYQIGKIEGKAARETLQRQGRAMEDASYLYNGLFPHKHLQERVYSILPFLARHGFDLIGRLYDNVHVDCPDHILLPV